MSNTAAPARHEPAVAKPRLGRTFWTLNVMEMWERLAYYNLRVMAPIYIMQADNPGGLHLTARDKGIIYAWWAVFQSLLPIVTGGIAVLAVKNGLLDRLFTICSLARLFIAIFHSDQ